MSSAWHDDDEARPRRKRRHGGTRAALVTSVGVIALIVASVQFLWFVGLSAMGLIISVVWLLGRAEMEGAGTAAGVCIGSALLALILSKLNIVSGIGVIKRVNTARVMALVMAGFSGVAGIVMIVGLLIKRPHESLILTMTAFLFLIHCTMAFLVLLRLRNAREFGQGI